MRAIKPAAKTPIIIFKSTGTIILAREIIRLSSVLAAVFSSASELGSSLREGLVLVMSLLLSLVFSFVVIIGKY